MIDTQYPTDLDDTIEISAIAEEAGGYVGRHRAPEPEFLDTFVEAAAEHTAELEAIGAEPAPLVRRLGRWFARNLTGTRVTVMVGTAGVLVGTGIGWVIS